jgi:dolichyl-phosphate-mannose-protein mannosyltransferase
VTAAAEAVAVAVPARPTLLDRLRLDRLDVAALGTLAAVAFVLRFFSPIFPDFIAHPFQGAPVSDCVHSTPVTASGQEGTLCGLAYPFQRGSVSQPGQQPQPADGQVFDEVYFPVFAHDDLKGVAYFDPEPPLAKLFIAAGEWGWGWFRATFQGAHGDPADLGFNTFGWRIMSCLFGTLCVPMAYLLARRLWPYRFFATAVAVLTCFDGMFFVQSRIGMIDVFPIFLIMLSYWLFLVHLGSRTRMESLVTLLLTGVAIGLAIAAKWISLAALASMILILVLRAVRGRVDLAIGRGAWAWRWGRGSEAPLPGGALLGPYVSAAVVSLLLIPALIYVTSWFPFFLRGQFHDLGDLLAYQKQAYDYHAHLTATHPYGSPWFSWPFLYRPVAYYFESQGLGTDQFTGRPLVAGMIDLGNPWIWWTSLPCLLALPYYVFRHRSFPAALILLGFVTQYLPWSRISRVIFLYHMFGGLTFMILALGFVLARIHRAGDLELRLGRWEIAISGRELALAHLGIAVLFFLYFYPVWTALPIGDYSYLGAPGTPSAATCWTDLARCGAKMWFPSWI